MESHTLDGVILLVAGSLFTHEGAAVDPLCLPHDPQYLKFQPGYQNWVSLYGAEYQTHHTPLDHSHDRNVPCALCQAYGRISKIMIPSHYECPSGWTRECYGYLMAGYYDHKAATQFTCIDRSLEPIEVVEGILMESSFTQLKHIVAILFLVVNKS